MHSVYKIAQKQLMLSPKTGKPLRNMNRITKYIKRLNCEKIGRKYIVLQSDLDTWNMAVKLIHGL